MMMNGYVLEDLQRKNGFYHHFMQKPTQRRLLSSLLLFILLYTPSYGAKTVPSCSLGNDFKFKEEVVKLKMCFQWPPSYCTGQIAIDSGGCSQMPEEWLIHGLLGYDVTGQSIDCSKHPKDKDITKRVADATNKTSGLAKCWRTLLKGTDDVDFWTEQWIKHGCCLGLTPKEYFNFALGVRNNIAIRIKSKIAEETAAGTSKHNQLGLNELFIKNGLKPGPKPGRKLGREDKYSPENFPAALYNELGLMTEIDCNERVDNKHLQLHEINFCINMEGELIDCATVGNYNLGKCTAKKLDILYPSESELKSPGKLKSRSKSRDL